MWIIYPILGFYILVFIGFIAAVLYLIFIRIRLRKQENFQREVSEEKFGPATMMKGHYR